MIGSKKLLATLLLFLTLLAASASPPLLHASEPHPGSRTKDAFAGESKGIGLKFGAATTFGLLVNSGTNGGSSLTQGGIILKALFEPAPDFAMGPVFGGEFDYINSNVLLSYLGVQTRWYLLGNGFPRDSRHPWLNSERLSRFAWSVGADFLASTFFLGSNQSETTQSLTGNYQVLNACTGLDLRLSRHLEVNLDFSAGLLTFSASDDRIRIQGYIGSLGLSYLW